MKIGYFNYLYDVKASSAGAAVHVEELARSLGQCGHEVFVHYMNRATGRISPSAGLPLWRRALRRALGQIKALLQNGRYWIRECSYLRDDDPDAVLIRYNYLNFSSLLAARMKRIPAVLEVNAPMAFEKKRFSFKSWNLPGIPEWIEKWNLRKADRIFVVSGNLKTYFTEQGIDAEKISVIPNGVDTERYHPAVQGDRSRVRYGLGSRTVLGYVGSFHYWHDMQMLTRFVRTTAVRFPDTAFLLVGEGPSRKPMEESLSDLCREGRVVFTGFVPNEEMPGIINSMDIVLAPYPKLEFFYYSPLKLFEYMAAGRAIIATRVGQVEELLSHGESGLLVPADDLNAMLDAAALLIQDPVLRKQLGSRARARVEQEYTWKRAAEKVLGLIGEACRIKNGISG